MGELPSRSHDNPRGRLFVVGTGPGDAGQLTARAVEAIRESEVLIGNGMYLDLLGSLVEGKRVERSTMGREVERAERAVELAQTQVVAIVSGGDPGVYGMASLVLELVDRRQSKVPVEVVPGITAAQAAAARLGSPISGDYVTLSLSDLLTPWEVIEARLVHAFAMGVPVVLYNPKSRNRQDHLALALEIAARHLPSTTPVGVVRDAYRTGEERIVADLGSMAGHLDAVDMHSIVIIGGEETRCWRQGKDAKGIITPRGYHRKYLY
jgi:precorrin-3B C17-methyltransferase